MSINESVVRVRPAEREDIPAIVAILRTSVTEEELVGFGVPSSELLFGDIARLSSVWQDPNYVGAEEVFVADISEQVVGCVTIEDRGNDLELVNIDVARNLQCQGIGTHLVQFVEHQAVKRGKRAVTLGTSRSAAGVAWKSLPWWQAQSYRVTHEEENDWTRSIGLGIREIRMRKDLIQ